MNTIGTRLRKARIAKGVTQEDAAKQFGVKRATVTQWELNKHDPDKSRFPAIAAYYGGDAEWYERGVGHAPPGIDSLQPARRSSEEVARENEFLEDYRQLYASERETIHAAALGYLALRKDKL